MATTMRIGSVGCLFALLLAVQLLVPVLSSERVLRQPDTRNLDQTYNWGSIRRGDRLIAEAVLEFPPGPDSNTGHSYESPEFSSGTRISAVQVIDMWQNGTNANIQQVTYQPDESWIKIDFVEQNGKGMAYTVKVWGGED